MAIDQSELRIKLLFVENSALLKEKLHHLESDRKRMESRCHQMDEVRAELELMRTRSRDWSRDWSLMVQVFINQSQLIIVKNDQS